jgi:hypothetical protein
MYTIHDICPREKPRKRTHTKSRCVNLFSSFKPLVRFTKRTVTQMFELLFFKYLYDIVRQTRCILCTKKKKVHSKMSGFLREGASMLFLRNECIHIHTFVQNIAHNGGAVCWLIYPTNISR